VRSQLNRGPQRERGGNRPNTYRVRKLGRPFRGWATTRKERRTMAPTKEQRISHHWRDWSSNMWLKYSILPNSPQKKKKGSRARIEDGRSPEEGRNLTTSLARSPDSMRKKGHRHQEGRMQKSKMKKEQRRTSFNLSRQRGERILVSLLLFGSLRGTERVPWDRRVSPIRIGTPFLLQEC